MWRSLLADALQADEDHLFGLHVDVALPRPLLLEMPVDTDVVDVLLAQRAAHIQAEHIFGPAHRMPATSLIAISSPLNSSST